MSSPSIAVLGCGYWGQNLVRNFSQIGSLKLVCDPAEAGRARAAQIAPGVETCAEFGAVFRRKDIDAVVIATPAETHFTLARQAMEAGMDALVEKPLALNFRDGLALEEIAKKTGRMRKEGYKGSL